MFFLCVLFQGSPTFQKHAYGANKEIWIVHIGELEC